MLFRVNDFYIEANSRKEAFMKYVEKRYDIYFSKKDEYCCDSIYMESWANDISLDDVVFKITDESAEEYFKRLLEYVHQHYPHSYYAEQGNIYEYPGTLILSEDGEENAVTVAAYNEGNGIYSVGPGFTGIGYLRLERQTCCDNFEKFLKTVDERYAFFCRACTNFKKHPVKK